MNSDRDAITLREKALRVRKHVLTLASTGGCFLGSAFSCADIIVYLYSEFLNINKDNLRDPDRDYFFLSKGHGVSVLLAMFVELGFLTSQRLKNHLKTHDVLYWHPNARIPGIEFHSGSLGHLLSVAAGVAYDIKAGNGRNRVVVMVGDGELNEGSIWESCLIAAAYKLDNLILVVDRNRLQANAGTEELIPMEPLRDKFLSFGMSVRHVEGHNFDALRNIFSLTPFEQQKPSVVIADTIRGKGLPGMENCIDRWFCTLTGEEAARLAEELYA